MQATIRSASIFGGPSRYGGIRWKEPGSPFIGLVCLRLDYPVYESRTLYQVPIDRILEDPDQPRKIFDPQALQELTASIAKHGILQPVLLRRGPNGTAIIVAGERRVAAAQQLGLKEVPGIFIDGNPAEIALVENLQRQDLTWVEEAEALGRLMTEQQYTQEQLGGIIGKARNTLNETLSLNKLPQEIRDDCRGDRTISRSALIVIARKKQERAMMTAYKLLKAKLQKGETPRQKKNPNDPKNVLNMMNQAAAKIPSLDTSAWTDNDKTQFQTALTGLRTEIDSYLNALAPAAPTSKKTSQKTA